MRKIALAAITLLCVPVLSACGNASSLPMSTAIPSPQQAPGSIETASVPGEQPAGPNADGTPLPFALNDTLLTLLNSDNASVKQQLTGRCYAEITGQGAASLTWFEPCYLRVLFEAQDDNWTDVWDGDWAEGFHEENPFQDHLPVEEIWFEDEIDPAAPALDGQESLRQLFLTEAPITYPMLCERLRQTPPLAHREEVWVSPLDPERRSASSDPGQPIAGGDDEAVFLLDGIQIAVRFIRSGDDHFAYRAVLKKT